MSGGRLTDEDTAALDAVFATWDWQSHELLAAVEGIVARHLEATAETFDERAASCHRRADDNNLSDSQRSKAIQRANAYMDAARIART